MIKFNQLSISKDGTKMIIDAEVKNHDFLKDVYLDRVIIDTHDTYVQGGPSSHPCMIRKIRWEDSLDKKKMCCQLLIKNCHIVLKKGFLYSYTGEEIKPEVIVFIGGELLREEDDYTIEYSNNINVGVATITITGKGDYTGTRTKRFDIIDMNEKSIQNCTIRIPQTYYKYEEETITTESVDESTGKKSYTTTTKAVQIKPSVTVINGSDTLVKGTDYTVSYGENNAIGEGTITITGNGDYTESRTITFQIVNDLPENNPEIVVGPTSSESEIEVVSEAGDSDSSSGSDSGDKAEDDTEEKCNCGCADAKVPEDFDPTDIKVKHARIIIDWMDIVPPMFNTMFFVYFRAKGTPSSDAPCGKDNMYTLGIAVNLYPLLNSFLCALRQLNNECDIPKVVIDNYLRFKAFTINVQTGHYIEAIDVWRKFFLFKFRKPNRHGGIMPDIYPNHAFTHGPSPIPHIEEPPAPPNLIHYHHHRHHYYGEHYPIEHKQGMIPPYMVHDDEAPFIPESIANEVFPMVGSRDFPSLELFGGPWGGYTGGPFFGEIPHIGGCNCGK